MARDPPKGSRVTGPAIATAPDGSVWLSQLGSYNALVRIEPNAKGDPTRVLYDFGGPEWCKKIRLIHLTFSAKEGHDDCNRIYALSSDLIDDKVLNAIIILKFDDDWKTCLARRIIPLPTQDCACHRIVFIDTAQGASDGKGICLPGREMSSRSIVVTELASSKLLQIKVRNLTNMASLRETKAKYTVQNHGEETTFEVRKYREVEDDEKGASF